MNGTEKIIAHIRAEAKAQCDDILARAEQQCAEIRAVAEAEARERYNDKLRGGEKTCEDRMDSMDRIARMEAKKGVLALKQEMIARGFALACEKLAQLPEDEYLAFLAKLAAKVSVTGEEEIVLNARDRARCGDKLVEAANKRLKEAGKTAKLTLSKAEGDFAGGLLLRRGSIETNCSVELLVEQQRSEMAAELAGVLFG